MTAAVTLIVRLPLGHILCTRLPLHGMADDGQTEDDYHADMSTVYILLTVGGVGVLLGLMPLLMTFKDRSHSSGVLRGQVLSKAVCAHCPSVRDCLLNCGTRCKIKCLRLGAVDSLESLHEGERQATLYEKLRYTRRINPTIIGVKPSRIIRSSAPAGYLWKKKWRERRLRSKHRRKVKNEARKLQQTERNASTSSGTTNNSQSTAGGEEGQSDSKSTVVQMQPEGQSGPPDQNKIPPTTAEQQQSSTPRRLSKRLSSLFQSIRRPSTISTSPTETAVSGSSTQSKISSLTESSVSECLKQKQNLAPPNTVNQTEQQPSTTRRLSKRLSSLFQSIRCPSAISTSPTGTTVTGSSTQSKNPSLTENSVSECLKQKQNLAPANTVNETQTLLSPTRPVTRPDCSTQTQTRGVAGQP